MDPYRDWRVPGWRETVRRLPRLAWIGVVVIGFLAFCSILRVPINVIPPLLTRLGEDLGMGEVPRVPSRTSQCGASA